MYHKLTYKIPVIVRVEDENGEDNIDSSLSNSVAVLQICCDAFNDADVGQYLNIPLKSCRMVFHTDTLLVECYLSDNTYNNWPGDVSKFLLDELNGQMSDGWGEGFEQFSYDLSRYPGNDIGEVYISCWGHDADQKVTFLDYHPTTRLR